MTTTAAPAKRKSRRPAASSTATKTKPTAAKETVAKPAAKKKPTATKTAAKSTTAKKKPAAKPASSARKTTAAKKTAPAKKTAAAKKAAPAASKRQAPVRDLNIHGFVAGGDSAKIADLLIKGGKDRAEINTKIAKSIGTTSKSGGEKNIPALASGVLRRLQEQGYKIESTWSLVPPAKIRRKMEG